VNTFLSIDRRAAVPHNRDLPRLYVLVLIFFSIAAVVIWQKYGRSRGGSLPGFAKLLERPEFVDGLDNWLSGRRFLKGDFRGRKVVIMQQSRDGDGDYEPMIVVSMETRAGASMETYELAGFKPDRETARALFALEVKHDLAVKHEERCLKAKWQPSALFFPRVFDPSKAQSVLEAMHIVASSIERCAPAPGVSAER